MFWPVVQLKLYDAVEVDGGKSFQYKIFGETVSSGGYKMIKQSRYRHGVAQRVPGS